MITVTQSRPAGSNGRTCSASRVVQHHQDLPVRDEAAVQVHLGRDIRADALWRHPEPVEEPADRLGDRDRRLGRVEPAQVDVELAVREVIGDLSRPPQAQGGLADTGHSDDHHDALGTCGHLVQLASTPHDLCGSVRQLARHGQLRCVDVHATVHGLRLHDRAVNSPVHHVAINHDVDVRAFAGGGRPPRGC
ncbi:hypothetical protein [Lentzea guizhouensis]|uniref:hypothetical protein n=1 Tax=Lentzea guizhouensis TaxID=1586287 RepID=UPI0012B68987|nr:hypothetical protein [Lentzea guizhouensis]